MQIGVQPTNLTTGTSAAPQRSASAAPPQTRDAFAGTAPQAPLGLIPSPKDGAQTLEQILNGPEAPEPHTRIFADSYGRVTKLALMLSPYVSGEDRANVLDAYKTLFTQMEPDTKFTIVVQTDQDQADVEKVISDNHVPDPQRITFLNPQVGDLTVWARDCMVGMYTPDDPAHSALLHQTTLHSWHLNDMQVPSKIAGADPSIVLNTQPDVVTDGGDVQSNTRQAFAGYYSIVSAEMKIADQMKQDPTLEGRLETWYTSNFGKQVVNPSGDLHFPFMKVANGEAYQLVADPAFHADDPGPGKVTEQQMLEDVAVRLYADVFDKPVQIMGKSDPTRPGQALEPATDHMDMGCTPIDDSTFLVGDPNLAKQVFAKMTPAERTQAEGVLSKLAGKKITLAGYSPTPGKTSHGFVPHNRDNPDDFDGYAHTLQADGYTVVRVPHLEPQKDGDPYISYNNCLMERFEKDGKEIRRVFLPMYGIPKLDDYATRVWQSQGFDVHPIPLAALSSEWGALRCISNWLDRSPRG